jgi:hypothetical protein
MQAPRTPSQLRYSWWEVGGHVCATVNKDPGAAAQSHEAFISSLRGAGRGACCLSEYEPTYREYTLKNSASCDTTEGNPFLGAQ